MRPTQKKPPMEIPKPRTAWVKLLNQAVWGGLKDHNKALTFYRLAAQKGHQQAAARVAQIEAELGQIEKKEEMPPPFLGH